MNYYADGDDKLGFHADDEPEHDPNAFIISLSFGATRDMQFKAKDVSNSAQIFKDGANLVNIPLESGDLLLMDFTLQSFYKHAIPQRKRVKTPRINITFRKFKR